MTEHDQERINQHNTHCLSERQNCIKILADYEKRLKKEGAYSFFLHDRIIMQNALAYATPRLRRRWKRISHNTINPNFNQPSPSGIEHYPAHHIITQKDAIRITQSQNGTKTKQNLFTRIAHSSYSHKFMLVCLVTLICEGGSFEVLPFLLFETVLIAVARLT